MTFVEILATADKTVTISPTDNSLIVDDNHLVNIDSLKSKGLKEISPELAKLTSYTSTQDENIMLWPRGNSDLAVVDLQKMEYDIIESFFPGDDLGYLPISLKSFNQGRKILGLSYLKTSQTYVMTYWNKVENEQYQVVHKPINSLFIQRTIILHSDES